MDEGFISLRLYRYINMSLLYSYVILAPLRLVLYAIESTLYGRSDLLYALTNLACVIYGLTVMHLKKNKRISEEAENYLTTELAILLILVYGHVFEPQHCYIFSIGSMCFFYFIQIPNLVNYPWVRYAASVKQLTYVIGFGVASGQVVINTVSDLMMPAAPLFFLFVALVYQLDVNRMMNWLAQLQETRAQLNAIITAVPVGLIVIKSNKELTLINAAAERLLLCSGQGQVLAKLAGFNYSDNRSYPFSESSNGFLIDVLHYISHDTTLEVTFGLIEHEGRTLSWIGNKTTWKGEPAAVLVAKDVTEIIQLEQERNESQYKNVMLRSVSHELRTPTNGILHTVASVAESPEIPQWAKDKLMIAEVCSKHLLMLINDLLDYSQLIAGHFSLVRSNFSLHETLTSCVEMLNLVAKQKQIQLVKNIDPLLPTTVYSDKNRLSQVVLNLLSNAIKFTHSGGRVELLAELDDQGMLHVLVTDNGIGIPTHLMPDLFRVFSILSPNSTMNPQGCGLGLHISNMLAQNLGGSSIQVQSAEGQGSTFSFVTEIFETERYVTVPTEDLSDHFLVLEDEAKELLEIPLLFAHNRDLPQILVVDDAPFNRLVVSDFLRSDGLRCVEAESGNDCIEMVVKRAASNNPIKLIIMDFEMPEMDGPTTSRNLLRILRELQYDVPKIIAHTAYTSISDQKICKDAGMIDFIPKPASKSSFSATIRLHMSCTTLTID